MADLYKQQDLGAKAAALVNDEALNEAFDRFEEKLVEALLQTSAIGTDSREKAYFAIKALRGLREELGHMVTDGEVAARQIMENDRNG